MPSNIHTGRDCRDYISQVWFYTGENQGPEWGKDVPNVPWLFWKTKIRDQIAWQQIISTELLKLFYNTDR